MWAESTSGEGTTFAFTLVAEAAPGGATRADLGSQQPPLVGKRLLVVDDNPTNRRIVVQHARAWGMLARDTPSPMEALEWIRRGDPFDVAILDVVMPEMDGVQLAAEIRKHRDARALPLVMFSALGRREAGADRVEFAGYLSKPIKPSHLLDVLMSVLAAQPARRRAPAAVRAR
jgi:CheY-like chemotaxis protein